jgi:hypothetical protein
LHTWKVVGRVVVVVVVVVVVAKRVVVVVKRVVVVVKCVVAKRCQRPETTRPTTFHICKTRGC